jgi:hypothetical protein
MGGWTHRNDEANSCFYQIWRVKTNEELDKLVKHKNIINHIKLKD